MNKILLLLIISTILVGCSSGLHRKPVPYHLYPSDGLFKSKTLRHWGDTPFSIEQYVFDENLRGNTFDKSIFLDEFEKFRPQHYLIISGGGANGAYGAGLLNGLTATGNRPEYRMVTGISTGAILGLYAFLGEEYDNKIRSFYTELSDHDIYQTRNILQVFSSPSLLNTSKFEELVKKEVNRELLRKVKREYLRGRTFLVQTTNLDAQRPVIWNMGEIAMHDTKEAEHLFQSVIIASASIPGIFDPVLIPIEINNIQYDELHVDGGVIAQAFFIPENMDIEEFSNIEEKLMANLGINSSEERESHIWMINNSRIGAIWEPTRPTLTDITGRSISTMIKYQGRNNISNINQQSKIIGSAFSFSYIDHRIPNAPSQSPFDKKYMQYMYCYGYVQVLNDNHWNSDMPNYNKLQNVSLRNNSDDIESFNWEVIDPGLNMQIEKCLTTIN